MSTQILSRILPSGTVLSIRQGDITQERVDVIVNAANEYLEHGGGVAGAIIRRGGDSIQDESDTWIHTYGNVPTGKVAITKAGKLPSKYIIHAVGPIWKDGNHNEDELLRSAIWNSLEEANKLQVKSISLPAISSGIFGFPKERCAQIIVQTAYSFCEQRKDTTLREINRV